MTPEQEIPGVEEGVMTEDPRSLLLESLVAQAGGGGGINVQQLLLSQLGGADDDADPTANLLARYLVQAQAREEEPPEDEEDEESSPELEEARSEERTRVFEQLRLTMEEIYEELEALRERNNDLAAALGACYRCWGEDFGCEICGGTGGPGSSMPDAELLARLVAPAARRLREKTD
jgi:hypothetical protein